MNYWPTESGYLPGVCVSCTVVVCMFRGCMVNFFFKMFLEHSWNLLVEHLSIWKLNYYDLSFKKKNYMICSRIELYFSLFIMISHDHATSWHCFMVKVNSNSNTFFQHLQLKNVYFFLSNFINLVRFYMSVIYIFSLWMQCLHLLIWEFCDGWLHQVLICLNAAKFTSKLSDKEAQIWQKFYNCM